MRWNFWIDWVKPDRWLYFFALTTFCVSLFIFVYAYLTSPELVLDTEKYGRVEEIDVPYLNFTDGLFEFKVPGKSLVIQQYYEGGNLNLKPLHSHVYVVLIGLALVFVLTGISYTRGFWYFVSVGLFIGFLVFLNIDQLLILNSFDNAGLIASFIFFLPLSYYFSFFRRNTKLPTRFILNFVAVVLFGF
jgi:hypothetical protein